MKEEAWFTFNGGQLRVFSKWRWRRALWAISPCSSLLLAVEERSPRRGSDCDLLREPSDHIRRCLLVRFPFGVLPHLSDDECPLVIRQKARNDLVMADLRRRLPRELNDDAGDKREDGFVVKRWVHVRANE